MRPLPYIKGSISTPAHPLEGYFSSYRQGVVSAWLDALPNRKGLILDPFGSSPRLILEAARHGYRILTAVNNPITRLVIRRLAHPLPPERLRAAAAGMAGSFKGEERLEPHLLSLYETDCPHCGAAISARAFIWHQSSRMPVRKICRCDRCGDQGEYPTNQEDVEKALRFQDNSLYHARALTRVAPPDNPVHGRAEKALQVYPSRAVYALFNLINKFTGLSPQHEHRDALTLLLLSAFSRSHGLQLERSTRPNQPHQLTLPAQYRENNVWQTFEQGLEDWTASTETVPVLEWPDLPPASGGISLFPGRFHELAPELDRVDAAAAAAVPPPPDPVLWTLSALWSGWLWGQEAAASLRGVLSLPKLDWVWYTRAVEHNLSQLRSLISGDFLLLTALSSLSSEYLICTFTAAAAAGFESSGTALDPDTSGAQLVWKAGRGSPPPADQESIKAALRDGGYRGLKSAGEPRHTLHLQAAGLNALDQSGLIDPAAEQPVQQTLEHIQEQIEETFSYRQGFLYYPEPETWWHQELFPNPNPLADQVEMDLVALLAADQPHPKESLEGSLYQSYPGSLTPPADLIELCLRSYGQQPEGSGSGWVLKPGDLPEKRIQDLEEMAVLLKDIGEQLGFETTQQPPIGRVKVFRWQDGEEDQATFFISASAVLNKILLKHAQTPPHPWIILPGSRARLVTYKLQHNPPLAERIDQAWGFIKFRHLRRLADEGSLTRKNYLERFELDPLTYDAPQLPLI